MKTVGWKFDSGKPVEALVRASIRECHQHTREFWSDEGREAVSRFLETDGVSTRRDICELIVHSQKAGDAIVAHALDRHPSDDLEMSISGCACGMLENMRLLLLCIYAKLSD